MLISKIVTTSMVVIVFAAAGFFVPLFSHTYSYSGCPDTKSSSIVTRYILIKHQYSQYKQHQAELQHSLPGAGLCKGTAVSPQQLTHTDRLYLW